MTYTLFDLTYRVARELGLTQEGVATSGSTTTLIDTVMRTEPDDYWNNGTVWVLRDAGGAGAAPEGEYATVSDFVSTTKTLTISALTAAIAGADRYACMTKHVPLHVIIQKINQAIMDLGPVPYADITSITTAADQTEYALPVAAKRDLYQVWIQAIDDDANDNQWRHVPNWRVQEADPGAAPRLIIPQYDAGYYLKLVYLADHPELQVATAVLSEYVPLERVIYPAVLACFEWRKQRTGWNAWDDQIDMYRQRVEAVKVSKPIHRPSRDFHYHYTGGNLVSRVDEPDKVYLE
ncbi:MAG: hypothetical protein WC657_07840 [Candidatus Paceibacterota bacterium]